MSAWRQEWAGALRKAKLSLVARMLGQVLALDYANGQTGQCNPSRRTLAEHLDVSEVTVKRAIAELVREGWLARSEGGTARNKTASYTFLSPGKVVAFTPARTANAGHARPATDSRTRVKSEPNAGHTCTPPYKGLNQVRTKGARATPDCPVPLRAVAHPDSERASVWNRWLTDHGGPSLEAIGQWASDGGGDGWAVPASMPPRAGDGIALRIAEKWAAWAAGRCTDRTADRRRGVA